MRDGIFDRATAGVAVSAIVSPAWLPALEETSRIAGHLLPILGVVWLMVQIVLKIRRG